LFSDEIVTKISAGTFHSAFLTETGRVWTCGGNNEGQLGLDEDEDEEPEMVITPYEVSLGVNQIIASDLSCGR
jgi:alpha-tubulin suppressor-like RCC1 family protein